MAEPKRKTDLVVLKNISGVGKHKENNDDGIATELANEHEVLIFQIDSAEKVVDKQIKVERYVADHAMEKIGRRRYEYGKNKVFIRKMLEIVELPASERTSTEYKDIPADYDSVKEENAKLKEQLEAALAKGNKKKGE